MVRCQQKRIPPGLSASSSSRDLRGDVDPIEVPIPMEEVTSPPTPVEPQPVMETSPDTDAMTVAGIHPYGHEELAEVNRAEFHSIIQDGSFVEEDTFEDFPTEEVVDGVNRAHDLMRSCPVYQAIPRAEVTGKVWSTRWCHNLSSKSEKASLWDSSHQP